MANIIIVSKFFKSPLKFACDDRRGLYFAGSALAVLLVAGFSLGYFARGGLSAVEVEQMQSRLAKQEAELKAAKADAQREINAMGARLGELQAQANRLNALGERLTRIGKLDDGEFDFTEPAGQGGAEPAEPIADGDLLSDLDALERQFARSGRQLGLLESLLFNRDLDRNQVPSRLPVKQGYVSSGFGGRVDPFGRGRQFHRGLDISGAMGSAVMSVADGVVSFAGARSGYGNVVEVDHGNGYKTLYAHNQRNLVKEGDLVRAGQQIARMGSTGRSTGSHVHFEVWENGRLANPRQFLGAPPRG